jgi:hypothetical protein
LGGHTDHASSYTSTLMINFNFAVRNPWSQRFDVVLLRTGQLLSPFWHWELQINRVSDLVSLHCDLRYRQDHQGIFLSLALVSFEVIFTVYDSRHYK